MPSRHSTLVALLALALFSWACKKEDGDEKENAAPVAAKTTATTTTSTSPSTTPAKPVPVDPENPDWVPKEFTDGIKRFKDAGLYVDGVPVGILKFGELPVGLKPVWYEEEGPAEFKGGEKPRFTKMKQRRYRFFDYFEAMGVDTARVKVIHLWGGTRRHVGVSISGDAFRKNKDFMFRFGSDVFGKPIPHCPTSLGSGGCPDNMIAMTAYVDKDPPEEREGYFYVDGKKVDGIPYYGTPVRGGVRVYKNGPMASWIKRHKLEAIKETEGTNVVEPNGTVRWNFFAVLKAQGVDTSDIAEAWIVHQNRHVKQIDRKVLETATFVASPKRGGEILFGTEQVRTNAIALHTKKIAAKDLPRPKPHELHE